ncbi:hypothetical protein GCK32_010347 [Trichostrongylus colubriformis]|uniref:Uncharacterized protein n=1 Tax=Trichostrongylus colubriformis TaxID=6319 RepID=A0AAN8FAK6_TRICO
MYITLFSCVIAARTVLSSAESYESTNDKRALSSFDTLGGIGLGKRAQISSFDSLGGLGIGLGKRDDNMAEEKKSVSSFDTLAGIGLGKRAGLSPVHVFLPYRAYLEGENLLEEQEWKRPIVI